MAIRRSLKIATQLVDEAISRSHGRIRAGVGLCFSLLFPSRCSQCITVAGRASGGLLMPLMLQELVSSVSSRIVNRARRVLPRPFAKQDHADDEQTANELAILSLSTSGWYNMRRQESAPGFRITHTDSVVDVGCGPGNASLFAAKQGAAVVSLDIDAAAIERLEQQMSQLRVRSFQGFVSHCNPVPLAAEHATVVLAMEVLEHVDDPAAFLAELVRIGKPGTRYLISVPDPASEAVQGEIAPPTYWRKPNHIRVLQRDEFLARSGRPALRSSGSSTMAFTRRCGGPCAGQSTKMAFHLATAVIRRCCATGIRRGRAFSPHPTVNTYGKP